MTKFFIILHLAAQPGVDLVGPPPPIAAAADPVLWPYLTAIAALATTCGVLWGAYVKASRDHAAELKSAHETYRKADEEKSKRQAEEHAKKDTALLDVSVKTADVLARVEGAIRESTNAMKGVQTDLQEVLRAQTR